MKFIFIHKIIQYIQTVFCKIALISPPAGVGDGHSRLEESEQFLGLPISRVTLGVVLEDVGKHLVEVIHEVLYTEVLATFQLVLK